MKTFLMKLPLPNYPLVAILCLVFNLSSSARVLDNFDDNTKTAWADFTFIPGFGIPVETDGQFKFNLPPVGQSIFSASTKTSETFTLQNGRTVEFRVDLVSGNGKDAFAVLAFIPTTSSAGTLAGYGFAKSTTDILITKGIGKYFYNENPASAIKNDNVTLVLSLTGQGTSVIITAKVLDKDNNNAVIFEKTVVDNAGADVLSDGTDSPAAPYFGAGNFVLYCYEDDGRTQGSYEVTLDNAEVFVLENSVLDNFDDNVKTAWADFTFIPGFGIPVEADGQFKFNLPPVGQSIFSASTKTSRTFDVVDGERLEFKIDLVSGNGKDAFAVLAFIPTSSSAGTLAGYGFAKSTTDILITKGIGKYFYNENPSPTIKNDNVTLVLSLTGRGTSVIITAKVLDKDNNNAVIFEKTVVDTAGADVFSDGTDSPAPPYFGAGNFVLYCYEDDGRTQASYEVTYDNAEVSAPPVTSNTAPIISEVQPDQFANFLPASTQISFKVTDDKPLVDGKISVILNGTLFNSANGLGLAGAGSSRTVSLGGLKLNVNYEALLRVVDADNATNSFSLYFDTFAPGNLVVEVEDYNFDGGGSIDSPGLIPEGSGPQSDAYANQVGMRDIDYSETRTDRRDVPYRPGDPVRMQHSLDKLRQRYADSGGAEAGIFDYDVGDVIAGEWLNYTRTFAPGSFEVYLRESYVNLAQGECLLEKVTSDSSQEMQTTTVLGSFLGKLTGFGYRNFALTDGLGQNKVIVRLASVETLRLRQVSSAPGDGAISQNYLIFVPVDDPGLQRASVTAVSPAAGSTVETVQPKLSATIQNRDTSVKADKIVLMLNGQTVPHTTVSDASGATASYDISPLPPSGSLNAARVVFEDNFGVSQTRDWSFTITYNTLNAANRRSGPGLDRGFSVRVVQAPRNTIPAENNLMRAEDQLAPNSIYPAFIDITVLAQVINYTQDAPPASHAPYFDNDSPIPGLYDADGTPSGNGTDDIAMEVLAYLDLSAGIHRFGVRSDDGYKAMSGSSPHDLSVPALAFHNGGPADETFDFVVAEPGLYPFRLVYYERGGDAHVEWFSVNLSTDEKTLLNDPDSPDSVKAYVSVENTSLQSAAAVTGPFADDPAAQVDTAAKQITVAKNGGKRFYRLRSDTAKRITESHIQGNNIVLRFE